jgi:hypothetical protein
MSLCPGLHALWPTPMGGLRHPQAEVINPLLARVFGARRVSQLQRREQARTAFFASDDDLLQRMWFQFCNHGAFHDVHTHGNCSWSGMHGAMPRAEAVGRWRWA